MSAAAAISRKFTFTERGPKRRVRASLAGIYGYVSVCAIEREGLGCGQLEASARVSLVRFLRCCCMIILLGSLWGRVWSDE